MTPSRFARLLLASKNFTYPSLRLNGDFAPGIHSPPTMEDERWEQHSGILSQRIKGGRMPFTGVPCYLRFHRHPLTRRLPAARLNEPFLPPSSHPHRIRSGYAVLSCMVSRRSLALLPTLSDDSQRFLSIYPRGCPSRRDMPRLFCNPRRICMAHLRMDDRCGIS